MPTYEKPIDGLNDLPEAISQGFTLGVLTDSSLQYIFKVSDETQQDSHRGVKSMSFY